MGMGFAVIVPEKDVDNTFKILNKYASVDIKVVGRIAEGSGVEVHKLGLNY